MFSVFFQRGIIYPVFLFFTLLAPLPSLEWLNDRECTLEGLDYSLSSLFKLLTAQVYNHSDSMIQSSLRKLFSTSKRIQKDQEIHFFSDFHKLKRTLATEYFFVRKNHREIGKEIEALISSNRWSLLRKGIDLINIAELDSWLTLRKIAITMQKTLNSGFHMGQMNQKQIEDMLSVMLYLRFEPVEQASRVYDSNQSFRLQLKTYIKRIQDHSIGDHYLDIARTLIHTNPCFFLEKRSDLERYIFDNLPSLEKRGFYFNDILTKGTISNFWTDSFKTELIERTKTQFLKPFIFGEMSYPTKIQTNEKKSVRKTEIEISNILGGYHYDICSNVKINQYEVDALLGGLLIVEYNGHHHYAINSDAMVPTRKESWRRKVLTQRGFVVSQIPYWQWKFLKNFQQKREYLMKKVQNDLLDFVQQGQVQ